MAVNVQAYSVMALTPNDKADPTINPEVRPIKTNSSAFALTPFFRTDPLLYHKFKNMVIFRSGNLYFVAQELYSIIRKKGR